MYDDISQAARRPGRQAMVVTKSAVCCLLQRSRPLSAPMQQQPHHPHRHRHQRDPRSASPSPLRPLRVSSRSSNTTIHARLELTYIYYARAMPASKQPVQSVAAMGMVVVVLA